LGWKILQETQQDELFFFLHMQAQTAFDVATAQLVVVKVVKGEGKGRALLKDQMVMGKPERVIELLVVIVFITMLQCIAQRLADLHLFGKAYAGGCPACRESGGGSELIPERC
jgi:hypothetical protein